MKWFRLYSDLVDDPKVQRLTPTLFRTWVNLLCLASKSGGRLPSVDDMAWRLRLSVTDAQAQLDELILAGLIDVADDRSLAPHNWDERQRPSDSSAERVRRHRAKKRDKTVNAPAETTADRLPDPCNVTGNGDVTPQKENQKKKQINNLRPTEIPRESTAPPRGGGAQVFDQRFALGGGAARGAAGGDRPRPPPAARSSGPRGALSLDRMKRHAEGLGLPVADLEVVIDRQKPRSPEGYFRGMCLIRLRERAPGVSDAVLAAALDGRPDAIGAVTSAILLAEAQA